MRPSARDIARHLARPGRQGLGIRFRASSTIASFTTRRPRATPYCSAGSSRVSVPRLPARLGYFSSRQKSDSKSKSPASGSLSVLALGALLVYSLYPTDEFQRRTLANTRTDPVQAEDGAAQEGDPSVWSKFTGNFEGVSIVPQADAAVITDKVLDFILPEWSKNIPGYVRKLQRELSMGPGTLAEEIWREAHDASIHPEIQYEAKVRVSEHLCDEEKTFLSRRKKYIAAALARYLGLKEEDVHPDDIPVIAMCGSGGGLRALIAGAGSFQSTAEDGLFDCTTYVSGVSGSCWLQSLYFSSITERDLSRVIDHLKARVGVHIAYPPAAFSLLTSAPTNKYILSGLVEKLKGNPGADFGLVDAYGMLLAARLMVPKGELSVNEGDFKLSTQQEHIRFGQHPLPIYTAVRHEIPDLTVPGIDSSGPASEAAKEVAKKEAWFQWFEMTPYEFFCEEFGAGIPTWAMGRRFEAGYDKPTEDGLRLPELRIPLLLGIWGSAFCASLSHYYREIRPPIKGISGLQAVDELIWGHNEDLSKVHPIDPASLPNFAYGMRGKLPRTVPDSIYDNEYIQLMDAGMSNNLPIYPLLRPGREVDIIVAFDASADVKTDNWLSEVEGYALQRGIKGWPVGIGWPKATAPPSTAAKELDQAQAESGPDVDEKLTSAQVDQAARQIEAGETSTPSPAPGPDLSSPSNDKADQVEKAAQAAEELGYCTVWVGRTQERTSEPPPPPIDDTSSWRLMEPDAGIAVVYLPYLANDKVPGVDPATSEYMSTWNFIYTPEQIDSAVALARANYNEGRSRIKVTVRAVYERKKRRRLEREAEAKTERRRKRMRLGIVNKIGHGDHFS
ncbi:acyl transferase/acyl hydrolase/lysophospholipase [Podospora aff. communis PSN243]|uniref:Lysophospholipase n=1 Tax=Podospora aff. communis PSN243 TaxID=3040156 RepID=A0AAV9H3U0_9PEZI|nr:acyl transferase/acyl hydrolase/lysophospholipase [Podospora aff. communis PSN243]